MPTGELGVAWAKAACSVAGNRRQAVQQKNGVLFMAGVTAMIAIREGVGAEPSGEGGGILLKFFRRRSEVAGKVQADLLLVLAGPGRRLAHG